jgi:bifunctional DNase/RNase
MKRKEVKILGLSYSQDQMGSYILVLSERKGKVKIPIIIKASEVQRIALQLEDIKSTRPLTHDVFKSVTDSYGIDIQEVYIYSLAEGIFYTKLVTSNGIEEVEVECSVGDGVILSSIYKCPIYMEKSVMNAAGIVINDDGTPIDGVDEFSDDDESDGKTDIKVVSVENLERMLEEALKNEDYDIAIAVRDRIAELKDKSK